MAKCKYCNKDMLRAKGCRKVMVQTKDGQVLNPIKYGSEEYPDAWKPEPGRTCGDCGCHQGYYHHPGCDIERCPACKGQLISCGCLK